MDKSFSSSTVKGDPSKCEVKSRPKSRCQLRSESAEIGLAVIRFAIRRLLGDLMRLSPIWQIQNYRKPPRVPAHYLTPFLISRTALTAYCPRDRRLGKLSAWTGDFR